MPKNRPGMLALLILLSAFVSFILLPFSTVPAVFQTLSIDYKGAGANPDFEKLWNRDGFLSHGYLLIGYHNWVFCGFVWNGSATPSKFHEQNLLVNPLVS